MSTPFTSTKVQRKFRRNRDAIRRAQIVEQIPSYTINGDPVFSEKEAAAYIGFAPRTVEKWRQTYPDRLPHIRIGRSVRYRKSTLDNFLNANTVTDGRGVRK